MYYYAGTPWCDNIMIQHSLTTMAFFVLPLCACAHTFPHVSCDFEVGFSICRVVLVLYKPALGGDQSKEQLASLIPENSQYGALERQQRRCRIGCG